MSKTANSYRGMVVSPHHLASEAGLAVLRDGGNAAEAAVATAAALCVVYPHMTGLGGDAFWTIHDPAGGRVECIDASGISGAAVNFEYLKKARLEKIPQRGPKAMITCPGAVSGWQKALEVSKNWGRALPLARLLEEAIYYAEHGYPVSAGQAGMIRDRLDELKAQPGFDGQFLHNGQAPEVNYKQTLPALGRTLRRLAVEGPESFYRGKLAASIAAELQAVGSPLTLDDLHAQHALMPTPLEARVNGARLFNCPPPSQGISSLMILGIYNALANPKSRPEAAHDSDVPLIARHGGAAEFSMVHGLVECTKQAFKLRDAHLADAGHMRESVQSWLDPGMLQRLAASIDPEKARPWGTQEASGDTVWLGVIDGAGRAVSCIQSIYFEFGTGIVLPECGITWHNRGLGFSLEPGHANSLGPRKRPFHTLNPALALFDDGRVMPYGTMGGEGQPQTQAAVFGRYAWYGLDPQAAVSAPRWLLGRTWGESSASLKLEADFSPELMQKLKEAGHRTETVPARNELMGHAGMLVQHHAGPEKGLIRGAADPRSDGLAACW